MLSAEHLKELKQVNVSKDEQKTMERVKKDFTASTNAVKARIVARSGQKRSSFYRVFRTGNLNARLLLAMSIELETNPFYYTGEVDAKEPYSKDEIVRFLEAHDGHALISKVGTASGLSDGKADKGKGSKRRKTADTKKDKKPTEHAIDHYDEAEWHHVEDEAGFGGGDTSIFEVALPNTDKFRKAINDLTEDDAVLLLKSLLRRSKAGGEAENFADLVKGFLLM